MAVTNSGVYGEQIYTFGTGDAQTFDCRNARAVIVRAATGATVTASAVDSATAAAHTTGAENSLTIAANTQKELLSQLGAWPYYRISSAGAGCRVSVITGG